MMPSNRMQTHQTMKLIMTTYPGFQALPKGVKQMLLVSESFFFDEVQRPAKSVVTILDTNGAPSFSPGLADAPTPGVGSGYNALLRQGSLQVAGKTL